MSDPTKKANGEKNASEKSLGDSPVAPPRAAETVKVSDPAAKVAAAIRTIQAGGGKTSSGARSEARNPLLDSLVYGDNDLVGLVAYAMHEVNRRDWCLAYEAANGRPPSDGELNAYLVGEQLERRLDTYRRLAEDALAKVATSDQNLRRLSEGVPDVSLRGSAYQAQGSAEPRGAQPIAAPMLSGSPALGATSADKAIVPPASKGQIGKLIVYLFFLLVAVAGLAWLLRYGMDITQPTK